MFCCLFFERFVHWIPFEHTCLLGCSFHRVDIIYIKSKFCETLKVINSVTKMSLIEPSIDLEQLSADLLYAYT